MTVSVFISGETHLAQTHRRALSLVDGIKPTSDVKAADLIFVAQDVYDHTDHKQLNRVSELLEIVLTSYAEKPIVVLSQVPPGFTRKYAEHRTPGLGFPVRVLYMVDTIIMKRAIERVRFPEQIILGALNPDEPLPLPLQEYLTCLLRPHGAPLSVMSLESAEMAKLAINFCLYKQIEMAHMIAYACKAVGADYERVKGALHFDRRIGLHAYLELGDPNVHLTRDQTTLEHLAGTSLGAR